MNGIRKVAKWKGPRINSLHENLDFLLPSWLKAFWLHLEIFPWEYFIHAGDKLTFPERNISIDLKKGGGKEGRDISRQITYSESTNHFISFSQFSKHQNNKVIIKYLTT